jgi:uncharacterized membrane protein YsdA (DUF1294 family)
MQPTLVYLLIVNAATFLLYGWDKWMARRGNRRVPEAWLLGSALAFGAPAAWLGVFAFRHKTRKASFLVKLVLVTLLDVAAVWLWYRLREE